MAYIIAYDLGTGGIKASLFGEDGSSAAHVFLPYPTFYPRDRWHEQRPLDWWRAVCSVTSRLLAEAGVGATNVCAVALSGHSLVAAPLDRDGNLLMDAVPIWSDTRATEEASAFFARIPYEPWYMTTGNGDPAETYSIMKLMWLQKHHPAVMEKTAKVVGSKDFINFKLTGNVATDYSYASGSGVFDLKSWRYRNDYIRAAGIDGGILPQVLDSHAVVGAVTARASAECGLAPGTPVVCGGVDNACMALGARGVGEGRVYTSLGSSSWIAVTSRTPILDPVTRPFIFAHIERGYYTSGVSIFAAGSAWQWARDTLCADLGDEEDRYLAMNRLAEASPPGANGVLFNPSLAGGSTQNAGVELKGSFMGVTMATTRADLLRSVLEGVAMDLGRYCLKVLKDQVELEDTMLLCGGGAKSPLWRQIFADVYGMSVLKTTIDQDAACLGAAAIAARGAGLWRDYGPIDALHRVEQLHRPDPQAQSRYAALMEVYAAWTQGLAEAGRRMRALAQCGVL